MVDWTQLFTGSCMTVSAVGLAQGLPPNNGANFGPDTPGTKTSGIQEALLAQSSLGGGTVLCLKGDYAVTAPFYFPGPELTLYWIPGSTLSFPNSLTGLTAAWTSSPTAGFQGFIWLGSRPDTAEVYSNQSFIGNGLVIDSGVNDLSNVRVMFLCYPGAASTVPYTGSGGNGWVIEGVVFQGRVQPSYIEVLQDSVGVTGVDYTIMPSGIVIRDVTMNAPSTTSASGPSYLFIRGGVGGRVVSCRVDCGQHPSSDHDPINITGSFGEVSGWTIENCAFINNGTSGQVVEVQGNARTGSTTGCHHIRFVRCLIDAGSVSAYANGGGMYIDDDINSTSTQGGWWNDIEFEDCVFLTGITQVAASASITVGGSPYTYTNASRGAQIISVSGGTVSSIKHNGNSTGRTSGYFVLAPTDTLTVTYTSAPTMKSQAFGRLRITGSFPAPMPLDPGSVFPWGRGNGSQVAYVGVGASGFIYKNLLGKDVRVTVSGGTGVTLLLNGASIVTTTVLMHPMDQLTINYTTTPTAVVQPA